MSHFDQFIQYRALSFKFSGMGSMTLDDMERMIEAGSLGTAVDGEFVPAKTLEDICPIPLRNVCAKLSVELVERLDNALGVLNMSKRQFIEAALIEALNKVDQVLEEVDAFEYHRERAEQEVE
jgi:hypothetical protein